MTRPLRSTPSDLVSPTYLAISGGRKPVRFIGLLGSRRF
jgi:hypothetical protein